MTKVLSRPFPATVLASAVAFALYTSTLAPTVGAVDSGELTLAAWDLGIPHPPGFPLYVLLTHLVSLVPVGSIAARVNFASALFSALAVAGVFRVTWLVVANARDRTPKGRSSLRTERPGDVTPRKSETSGGWPAICGAMTAALIYMSLRTIWAYATVAEVYALTACLTVWIWHLMLRPSVERMGIAAVLFGLALGTHPAIVISMLPAFALLAARSHGVEFFRTRRFAMLFVFAALGAGVYLYLPVAALRSPILNWGDPGTPDRFWAHVSGLQYRGGALEITYAGIIAARQRAMTILSQQFGGPYPPVAVLLVAIGAVHTFRHQRTVFISLVTWILTNVALTIAMNAGWAGDRALELSASVDLDAYFIPTFIGSAVFAGAGVTALLTAAQSTDRSGIRVAVAGALAAIAIVQPATSNWRVSDRRADLVSRHYVDDVLQSIAPDGLVLIRDWNLTSPMMYVQHVEGERRDVMALDLNLIERRWYAESFSRRHPQVFASVEPELSAFLNLGGRWQQDPRSIQRDPAYHAVLNDALDRFLLKVVDLHLRKAPVYVTFEVVVNEDGKQGSLATKLASRYQLVPQGLVFRLAPDVGFHDPLPLKLRVAPLLDSLRRGGPNQLIGERIAMVYRDMLISRGLYLERNGRCPEALVAFGKALSIDSTSPMAATVKGRCSDYAQPPARQSGDRT